MNTKYSLIIFGSFFVVNALFMYLMLSGNLDYFIIQFKWFMRITAPFFVIYLFSFPVHAQGKTILILGDSLSASYGIPVEDGWVSLLEQRLVRQNMKYKVYDGTPPIVINEAEEAEIDAFLDEFDDID